MRDALTVLEARHSQPTGAVSEGTQGVTVAEPVAERAQTEQWTRWRQVGPDENLAGRANQRAA